MSMKSFLQYLTEGQKTYEFRIKMADIDPADHMEQIKSALSTYDCESVSAVKRLPIKDSDIDFPNFRNCQIYLMDAVLKYPCNDQQLKAIIAERAGIPHANVLVVPKNHPEEQRRWNEDGSSDIKEYRQGDAELLKPYEDNADGKAAGQAYAKASLLKELAKTDIEIAGGRAEDATGKTTNELPLGTQSPVGSRQNQIPSPIRGQKK